MNEQLLKKHFTNAPRMAPKDAVKLAFQSAFGCGHLLSAREACADFVRREMEQVPQADVPAFEPIGRGLCRLNLASAEVRALSPERIADLMMLTNEHVRSRGDNQTDFEQSLTLLTELAEKGETPFSAQELDEYLTAYRAEGCPVVSHSEGYREAYHPAYRVVLEDCARLLPVIARMDRGANLVVIDGPCGSGKTTLGRLLASLYGTQPIPMDDFFLPFEMRTPKRMAQAGGNIHHERFSEEILGQIQVGEALAYNRFDCATGNLVPKVCPAAPVIVIEGSYSHHPAFDEAYKRLNALRVFLTVDDGEQLRRIQKRNPGMFERFVNEWIPLEKTYFEAYDRKEQADMVLTSQPWNA